MASASPIEQRPSVSLPSRLLFFAGALVALGIGTIITLGAALAGVLTIVLIAYRRRRKGTTLTRRGAWLAGVVGTSAVLAILTGILVVYSESIQAPMTPAERAEQRARATQAVPDWVRAVNPNADRQKAATDSMAAQLLENRAVMIWAGLMVVVIASAILGTIAGSFAWGGAMLFYRGYRGEWLPAAAVSPAGL